MMALSCTTDHIDDGSEILLVDGTLNIGNQRFDGCRGSDGSETCW